MASAISKGISTSVSVQISTMELVQVFLSKFPLVWLISHTKGNLNSSVQFRSAISKGISTSVSSFSAALSHHLTRTEPK